MIAFSLVYLWHHKSWSIFLSSSIFYFITFGLMNIAGAYIIYRPIDHAFKNKSHLKHVKKRINYLTLYSSVWIFIIGSLFSLVSILLLFLSPDVYSEADVFSESTLPPKLVLSFIPSLLFTHAIFPAFITWFIINDFNLDLKTKVFADFQILFSPGKKKVAVILFFVFVVLGLIPTLLVTMELVLLETLEDEYSMYTTMNPIQTILVDRFIVLIGMLFVVLLIARSFTKPIYALLERIDKVRTGDFTSRAAVITEDEIGVLTYEFNGMVKGLHERELMRDTFGKYVTKDVANVILDKKVNIDGERRLCTILVTDIAHYTTLSEGLAPEKVVQRLNAYFSVVVDIIQQHHGIVNKFVGDSIFAMFNVPLDDPGHAVHAIQSALAIEQITRTRTFGEKQKLITRIGINTGEVIAGNIGSADRLEYTVIGDDVNIAARLEQLNKKYGTHILVGENTFAIAKDFFHFTQLGVVQLEGKERKVGIYQVRENQDGSY